jgi:hypothetical protein
MGYAKRRNPTVITLFELAQALEVSHVELDQPEGDSNPTQDKIPKKF